MKKVLVNIMNFIITQKNEFFLLSKKEQLNYLNSLGECRDDWTRSYLQYKCQCKLLGKPLAVLYNMCSIPIYLYWTILFYRRKRISFQKIEAIFFGRGLSENYLPMHLKSSYKEIKNIEDLTIKEMFLNESAKKYIKEGIRRFPFSFYFLAKCLYKIAEYSMLTEKYAPDVIIASIEYSFTSAVLTGYCERQHIKHINVMHGDKPFLIRDAFTRFHMFYVWDQHYVELFNSLKGEKTLYYVEKPKALLFEDISCVKEYDYTYYLQTSNLKEMILIEKNLKKLKKNGKIAIRPHPIYSKIEEVRKVFRGYEIEECQSISIEISILRTKNVISLYSTVLYQAYLNNVEVTIDDLTYPEEVKRLKDLDYIMLTKKHKLLSELLA